MHWKGPVAPNNEDILNELKDEDNTPSRVMWSDSGGNSEGSCSQTFLSSWTQRNFSNV